MKKFGFELEKKLLNKGFELIISIDEAGRGPLAGPVVAAATTPRNLKFLISNFSARGGSALGGQKNSKFKIQNSKFLDLIRDSKTLSHKQREKLFDFIHEHFYVGVGICDHKTVDRINILQATFLAMKKSITDLKRNIKRFDLPACRTGRSQPKWSKEFEPHLIILVDGNRKIPNFSHKQKAIPNGDKLVKSISAASIIAKVTRDRLMLKMHKKYPQYYFHKHKGYGTKLHLEMLKKHGPCKIHRRSFKPVKLAS